MFTDVTLSGVSHRGYGDRVIDAADAWERLLTVRTPRSAEDAGLVFDDDWRWADTASEDATALARRYTPLCLDGTVCAFAQLGQSSDGFIAPLDGHPVYVTGEQDRLHLHRLRALADAVVVGAGTAIADDPRLTVRACAGTNPVRVVLDRSGRVPRDRRVFTDGEAPTLLVCGQRTRVHATGFDVLRLPGDDGFDTGALLTALVARGLSRVLVEGGAVTVSRFLRQRSLHRLFVTSTPDRLGAGVPGLARATLGSPNRRFGLGRDTCAEYVLPVTTPATGV